MTRKEEINNYIHGYLERYNRNSYESYAEMEDIGAACSAAIEYADKTMLAKMEEYLRANLWKVTSMDCVEMQKFVTNLRKALED